MNLSKTIASIFGIGYIRKGGGTVAAAFAVLVWWLLFRNGTAAAWPVLLTIAVTALGVAVGNQVERDWGKDSYRVVIDEVAGMFISVLFVPLDWKWLLTGFVLFRFFDIAKPLYIRKMEAWKGGWGVMMDDVLAGIYANIILQVIIVLYTQLR
ncbi:phosphatidylglycerophosphatase A family protein [Taibaiella chishuiensis]|uniref:Phosphatidylglycerophosphatase A n=1 Tax=Taibaiella chishuiensis TaxID=1434707 RepID=A0A2P8DCR1_9BACT|nr:phosphatidylglycerophosphatase A [Taibaiella chishuiensis]PSK95013.1 phosphatidylglycerophosphatase A [Taibaiella chishuiensis]